MTNAVYSCWCFNGARIESRVGVGVDFGNRGSRMCLCLEDMCAFGCGWVQVRAGLVCGGGWVVVVVSMCGGNRLGVGVRGRKRDPEMRTVLRSHTPAEKQWGQLANRVSCKFAFLYDTSQNPKNTRLAGYIVTQTSKAQSRRTERWRERGREEHAHLIHGRRKHL